jgi:DNA-binding NarL/FixJ family response regulator
MLKLILADNQAIFRAGIAKVLAVEDEMRIVAQAQTPEQMFMALDKFRAAVLVVAAGFPQRFCRHRAGSEQGENPRGGIG